MLLQYVEYACAAVARNGAHHLQAWKTRRDRSLLIAQGCPPSVHSLCHSGILARGSPIHPQACSQSHRWLLQDATEAALVEVFADANGCCIHRKGR
jgi:hypothetical protein